MAQAALDNLDNLDEADDLDNVPHPLRRQRLYRDRLNPFDHYDNFEFRQRFRFSKEGARFIINLVQDELKHENKRGLGLPPYLQVLTTLQFFATGTFQSVVGDIVKINQSTVSRTIKAVSFAIAGKKPQFIKFPHSDVERRRTIESFYEIAHFPGVVGAIDCTHIKLTNPGGEDSQRYINRKGWHSLNCQVVGDANMKITNIVARWPGSVHDSRIFHESILKEKFETQEYEGYLLGDGGYPALPYLLTPLLNPTTQPQRAYNSSHIRTRTTIERLFGIMKRRFPCLSFGLRVKLETSMAVIVAVAILHNIARQLGEAEFDEDQQDLQEDEDVQQNLLPLHDNVRGNIVRARLIQQYFT